ncbi:MAG: flagellar biosynthesis protein FlhA [Dehalococcoidia bacterium]
MPRSGAPGVNGALRLITKNADVALAAAVMMTVLMMVIPLPPAMLDLLVASNIAIGVTILLISMYTKQVLEFSVFPSLLLLVTLFRLAINVSSTRLILLNANAGHIIESFGNFVIGGSIVVGIVVFLILLVIQFVVITNGAGRVAEVAARFTLDAMPGKQMSIDADLNAGLINETEARERRSTIMREADFYGSMDGASKFVKGDAIAGLIIVAINLIGGITIGVMQRGLSAGEAMSTYSLLTVGDGLVSQIPALLISTATGLIVTRAASEGNLGTDIGTQLLSSPRALFIVAAVLGVLAVVPGLPRFPFIVLALTMGGAGYLVRERVRADEQQAEYAASEAHDERASSVDSVLSVLQVDPLEVEVGYGLIPLVDGEHGGSLLNRITIIRRQMAMDLGIVVPMIRIRDNLQLSANTYVVKLRGIEIGRGELMAHQFLAMNAGLASEPLDGVETVEPAFGLPARWIAPEAKQRAEFAGYTVVDPPSVLTTHLSELIRRHAPELLSRQDAQGLLNNLRDEYPAVVEELVPAILTVGEVQGVLQELLREGVSVRDMVTICEALADRGRQTKETDQLTEAVRAALGRQITMSHRGDDGRLRAITLHPRLEQTLAGALQPTDAGPAVVIEPDLMQRLLVRLANELERAASAGFQPVLLCSARIRRPIRRMIERSLPQLPVLAYAEVSNEVEVEAIGMVEVEAYAA